MEEFYLDIRGIHIGAVILSGSLFLIRAAGRSKEEILQALQDRLSNTAGEEEQVVQQQLREIAVHRLEGMISQ